MKHILTLVVLLLFTQCELLDSSDVDENSTFLERFDGVGFENEDNGENEGYEFFFDDKLFNVQVRYGLPEFDSVGNPGSCAKCINKKEGENFQACNPENQYTISITENSYNTFIIVLDNFRRKELDGTITIVNYEEVTLISVIDRNTLSYTTTTRQDGGVLRFEGTLKRSKTKYSSIDCTSV